MSNIQILISTKTETPDKLRPGELAYSYKSGKLFIGPPGRYKDPPSSKVVELLHTGRYISQNINEGVHDLTPSSDAIYKALQEVNNTITIEYETTESGPFTNSDTKIIKFDGNLNVQQDPNDSTKIQVAINPYWGNIDIDNQLNSIIPNNYDNLKFKSGQGIIISAEQGKIEVKSNIDDNDINGSPNKLWSSQKIREAIAATTGISPEADNDFTGINTFQDINIINADPTSKQVVNTKSVKDYVGTVATQILDGLSLNKFVFNTPSMNWLVIHNKNTPLFQKTILDEYENEMLASVNIIDDNSFVVELTEAMIGSVLLRF
ncbi:MAG: hypothetical protein H8D97_00670 [Proteobacteria bacterium]|nr:hypothetical protein [Pseudomonadota bacterium]